VASHLDAHLAPQQFQIYTPVGQGSEIRTSQPSSRHFCQVARINMQSLIGRLVRHSQRPSAVFPPCLTLRSSHST
jgi:hypothetical protein